MLISLRSIEETHAAIITAFKTTADVADAYLAAAKARLLATAGYDLSEQLGIDVTDPDADSAAGLLLAHLRHMPVRGETITHQGVRFTVMGSDERRVTLVAVEPEDLEAADGDEHGNHDADAG